MRRIAATFALAMGCTQDLRIGDLVFACETSEDCAPQYVCAARECAMAGDAGPPAELDAGPQCPEITERQFHVSAGAIRGARNGTRECPFASVGEALAAAASSSIRTIALGPGMHTREAFPLVVRGGFTIEGAGSTLTQIIGGSDVDTTNTGFGGGQRENKRTTILIGDPERVNTIRRLKLASERIDPIETIAVLCDRGNTPGTSPLPLPNTIIEDVEVEGPFTWGIVSTVTSEALGGCNMLVRGSTLSDLGNSGVNGIGRRPTKAAFAVERTRIQRIGGHAIEIEKPGCGVKANESTRRVSLTDVTIDTALIGALLDQPPVDPFVPNELRIRGSSFTRMTQSGVELQGSAQLAELTATRFLDIRSSSMAMPAVALRVVSLGAPPWPRVLHARSNRFVGNDIGVKIELARDASDFGTLASPGNNVFSCNSGHGMGADFWVVTGNLPSSSISAAGNVWDHAPPAHRSDPADGLDVRDGRTRIVDVSGARTATEACPPGTVPGPPR